MRKKVRKTPLTKPASSSRKVAVQVEIVIMTTGSGRRRIRRKKTAMPAASASRRRPHRADLSHGACDAFTALGHPQRAKLALTMVPGGATYADLREATGMQPGPLYHHIQELRLAGLVGPKTRDAYELTPLGREAVLAAKTLDLLWCKGNGRSR